MLEFEILGSLLVRSESGEVAIPGRRRRSLLIRLLIAANRAVPADVLIEEIWEQDPPRGASQTLQSHISFLRKTLGDERVRRSESGYLIVCEDVELDSRRFEIEQESGRNAHAAGDFAKAADDLASSLQRWRGEPLADVNTAAWALPEIARLLEVRVGAMEAHIDCLLHLGLHSEAIGYAELAVAEHAFNETFWSQLMLALYRSGRQADALKAYQRLRTQLGDELGIEPSTELVALDEAVLLQKPELDWVATVAEAPREPGPSALLPSGTVTLVHAEIDGAADLWQSRPDAMHDVANRFRSIAADAVEASGGFLVTATGERMLAAFDFADDGITAAVSAQRSFVDETWSDHLGIRVRIAIHTGDVQQSEGQYVGLTPSRVAELGGSASGGQILLTSATESLLQETSSSDTRIERLGAYLIGPEGRREDLFQITADGLPSEFSPPRLLKKAGVPTNLPVSASSFVGRDFEIADLIERIGKNRVVTLTGPGGVGKTRLAIEIGRELLTETPDGVWLVGLETVTDEEFVPSAVLEELGIGAQPGIQASDTLVSVLEGQSRVLILDNCEQVIDACAALVSEITRRCAGITVLSTSREPLLISGEEVYQVPSLSLPPEQVDGLADLQGSGAASLFIDRLASLGTGLALTDEQAPVLASVCRKLDGIPLAVELASARLRSMSIELLDQRLEHAFAVLTGGRRATLPRQTTLQALVDWSYDLLSSDERVLFRRISVFAHDFDLTAAEEVCRLADLPSGTIEGLLTSLVDKSLLIVEHQNGTVRFRMLEIIRQYGYERLVESNGSKGAESESAAVRSAHSEHYLRLAEEIAPQLDGREDRLSRTRLNVEKRNLLAAIQHVSVTAQGADRVLAQFWSLRRYWIDALEPTRTVALIEGALNVAGSHATPERKRRALYCKACQMTWVNKRFELKALKEVLDLSREANDRELEAQALANYSRSLADHGLVEESLVAGAEGLALAREINDKAILGSALFYYGIALAQAESPECEGVYLEALSLFEEVGGSQPGATAHSNYACFLLARDDFSGARRHLEMALDLTERELTTENMMTYINLGWVLANVDDPRIAASYFREALLKSRLAGIHWYVPYTVLGLAFCATKAGELEHAALLHGVADALIAPISDRWEVLEERYRAEDTALLKEQMGAEFERHYAVGGNLSERDMYRVAMAGGRAV